MLHREQFMATLLVAFSALIGVGIVETGYRVWQNAAPPVYDPYRRIMFFDGSDSIFRNVGDIWTYTPNNDISSLGIYFTKSSYSPEYAYKFKTNNFGLVQDKDLVAGAKSVLVLGDSLTEGQGAEPWFRKIAPQIERLNYQPINGGLLGTGFPQWWQLDQFLAANGITAKKLIVIFNSFSLSYTDKWNFTDSELDCLININRCRGNESFFRLPPASELPHWVGTIRATRVATREPHDPSVKERIKLALPASYQVYRFFISPRPAAPQTEPVMIVIKKMIQEYGRENVLFIQLPEKVELEGAILPDGLLMRKLIQEVDGQFADGTSLCGLTSSDFFVRDEHPNQQGYTKIAKCVAHIIEPFLIRNS
jgi:hypothetical protein